VKQIRTAPFRVEIENLFDLKPGPEPMGLRSALRPYQRYGYDWLWWLRTSKFGGVLADDMGLGKTHQTMALLTAAYESGAAKPSLVVAPASVVDQWQRKIKEHAPLLMPYLHHGETRLQSAEEFKPLRVVLTTYGLMTRDIETLSQVEWETVVLDEAHLIKTAGTRTARAAKRLRADHRLALTGTPLENRPAELWSIFDFATPGYLGSFEKFRQSYEIPIVKERSLQALEKLRDRIAPFKLRRLKEDVLEELPPKQEDKIYVDMSAQQEALYRTVCEKRSAPLLRELADASRPVDFIHVFATLTRLKQICDHPALVLQNGADALESGKFDAFRELLQQCLDCGRKVVVFSQYVEMLKIVEEHLRRSGVGYSSLHGASRNRGEIVSEFNRDPSRRVFVASLLAGGVGIDLQAASVVIHYDRWWNPAKEEQATDRCHRMGQTRSVQVFKLITRRSVEEKIDALISAKAKMFDSIVQTEADLGKALTREELMALLTS
jgi:SNF2 family DNA or RNA helicase